MTTEGNHGSFLRAANGAWIILARIGEGFEIEDLLAVDESATAWVSPRAVA